MGLFAFIVALLVLGLILFLVRLAPVDDTIKQIIKAVVVVVIIIVILQFLFALLGWSTGPGVFRL